MVGCICSISLKAEWKVAVELIEVRLWVLLRVCQLGERVNGAGMVMIEYDLRMGDFGEWVE